MTYPIVRIARGTVPKPVTFIYSFYDNNQFLAQQIAGWRAYPADLLAHLTVIIVDDASRGMGPRPLFDGWDGLFPVRLFRIAEDRRWNWLAARNIGAHQAADGWVLLTDMDHVVPAETLEAIIYGQHDPKVIYLFSRREHTGAEIKGHSASFLITRAMFWNVGGYDERYSGLYGTDGLWRRRCAMTAPIQMLTDVLIRHEFQGDSSTTTYLRKQPEDAAVQAIAASLPPGSAPVTLSFDYQELAL